MPMNASYDDRMVEGVTHFNKQKQSEEERGRDEPLVDSGKEINTSERHTAGGVMNKRNTVPEH